MAAHFGKTITADGREYVIEGYNRFLDMFECRELGRNFRCVLPIEFLK